eukprot:6616551-Prymnesium_polylepis.1
MMRFKAVVERYAAPRCLWHKVRDVERTNRRVIVRETVRERHVFAVRSCGRWPMVAPGGGV